MNSKSEEDMSISLHEKIKNIIIRNAGIENPDDDMKALWLEMKVNKILRLMFNE